MQLVGGVNQKFFYFQEARKCAQHLTKQHQKIAEKSKAIKGLQSVTKAYHVVSGRGKRRHGNRTFPVYMSFPESGVWYE